MNNLKRKLLPMLLCAAMLLSVVCGAASFAFAEEHDHDHEAHVPALEASITEAAETADGDITITFAENKCNGKYCLPLTVVVTAKSDISSVKVNDKDVTKDVTYPTEGSKTQCTYKVYDLKDGNGSTLTIKVVDSDNKSAEITEEVGEHNYYKNGRMIRTYHAATCTEDGYEAITRICEDCGYEYEMIQPSNNNPKATGHSWKKESIGDCNNGTIEVDVCEKCGIVKEPEKLTQHTWDTETVTPATCDQPGTTTKTCTKCGVSITVATTRELGHWVDNTNFTETPCERIWTYECIRPGCEYSRTSVVKKAEHVFEGGKDCTQPKTCINCGKSSTDAAPYDAHEWGTEYYPAGEDGHVLRCIHDGCEQTGELQEHTWITTETGDCEQGLVCSVCGYVKESKLVHNFGGDWYYDGEGHHYQKCLNPGCDAKGNFQTCSGRDDSDCTTDVICSVCGGIAKKGAEHHDLAVHKSGATSLGHWVYCQTKGCSCGYFEEHTPESDDHDCTTDLKCSACDYVLVAACSGHNYSKTMTGDEKGHWQQCTNEGCESRINYSEHGSDTYPTVARMNPDCTHDGIEVTTYFCRVCNAPVRSETKVLPATGHDYDETGSCKNCGEKRTVVPGDVDGDGKVSLSDALSVMRDALGSKALTPEQIEAADYNHDGKVTLSDALIIMRHVLMN